MAVVSGRASAKVTGRDFDGAAASLLASFNKAARGSEPSVVFNAEAAASRQAFSWPLHAAIAARPIVSTADGACVTVFAVAAASVGATAVASSTPCADGLASQSGSAARIGEMR